MRHPEESFSLVSLPKKTGNLQVLSWLKNEDNSKKTVCDAGCGVGSLALPMATKFQKVYASDIAASMTSEASERAKQLKLKNLEFKVSDMENLKGSYDTVTCIDVMIHYPTSDVTHSSLSASFSTLVYLSLTPSLRI